MYNKCLKTLSEKNRKNKRKTQQKQAKTNVRIHTYIFFSSINMTTKLTCINLQCTYLLYTILFVQIFTITDDSRDNKINIFYNILCIFRRAT